MVSKESRESDKIEADVKNFQSLFEYNPEILETFLESIFTPAGLNLGAQTPEEIALSILAEILATIKNKTPNSLKEITGKIHTT